MQTVNMAGCPSHMLMEENGCTMMMMMMIQAIISERAGEEGREMENTECEMWRIGRHSQAVLTQTGKMTVYRVRVTSVRGSLRDPRSK